MGAKKILYIVPSVDLATQSAEKYEQYESYLLMNQDMVNEFGNNFYFYKNVQGFISEHKNFS